MTGLARQLDTAATAATLEISRIMWCLPGLTDASQEHGHKQETSDTEDEPATQKSVWNASHSCWLTAAHMPAVDPKKSRLAFPFMRELPTGLVLSKTKKSLESLDQLCTKRGLAPVPLSSIMKVVFI